MSITETLRQALRGRLEKAYATHYGWDIDVMHGRKVIRNNLQVPHTISGPLAAMAASRRPVHRIVPAPFGRFGNQVIQLKNAGYIAEKTGANIIQKQYSDHLFRPEFKHGYIFKQPDQPVAGRNEVVMRGSFYYAAALNIKLTPDDHPRLIRNVIRPLLVPGLMIPDDRVGAG